MVKELDLSLDYKVKDLNLADFGRKEMQLSEREMPGLMECIRKYGPSKPLKGLRITGSLHMTIQTAMLIRTLYELGADIRWASCNIFSTQDHAAAAIAADGMAKVFAWKGESLEDYWWCTEMAQTWPDGKGPDLIVDDGGDATLLIHKGCDCEDDPSLLDKPASCEEEAVILARLKNRYAKDPHHWHNVAAHVRGVSEETTTGVHRLKALAAAGHLAFPMIAVNDAYCKYLFDNRYGTGQSSWDGIMRTTNMSVAGRTVVVAGYGWCGKGVAMRAKGLGANVIVTEVDPIKGIEAVFDGFRVMPMQEAAKHGDIFVTVTGCKDVITKPHMEVMKNGAVMCNAGHFDVEINKHHLEELSVVAPYEVRKNIMTYTMADGRKLNLLGEGRLVNLACGDGHPIEIMDLSFAMQFLAMKYLLDHKGAMENKLYVLPEELNTEIAALKLQAMGAGIDTLSDEQKAYLAAE